MATLLVNPLLLQLISAGDLTDKDFERYCQWYCTNVSYGFLMFAIVAFIVTGVAYRSPTAEMKLYRRLQINIVVPRIFGMITRIWHIITLDYVVIYLYVNSPLTSWMKILQLIVSFPILMYSFCFLGTCLACMAPAILANAIWETTSNHKMNAEQRNVKLDDEEWITTVFREVLAYKADTEGTWF